MSSDFCKMLELWYIENKRDLPWRKTSDSYTIWLSEIILQQTRVTQGLPYFLKFLDHFPTVDKLASASEEQVLKLWQGLGYYSRARNLHSTSKMVMDVYGGVFPKTYKELIKLKGVGVYTASAIASFSNNEPVAVVDGNVYRMLSRIFGIFTPINSKEGEKEFKKLADSLLNKKDPALHNQAIMEFGALACVPKKPNCSNCIFNAKCYAFKNNVVSELPVKLKKTKIRKRYFTYFVIQLINEILIKKREENGIWKHLYEFPVVESVETLTEQQVESEFAKLFSIDKKEFSFSIISALEKPHKLSHQHIYASFYRVELKSKIDLSTYVKVGLDTLEKYPVPVLISNFMKENDFNEQVIL